jgi:hypothetical protein
MKVSFESIKNLKDHFTYGKGHDKKEPESAKQDTSNEVINSIPQNQENNQQPVVVGESNQVKPDATKTSKRRTVVRLCHYCHVYFTAHRRDANFCSASHRQMANKKGYYFRYHGNPEEHYLIKAINFYIDQFLNRENKEITRSTASDLYHMVIMADVLFINGKLPQDNHLVEFYSKHIWGFCGYLSKQFRNLDTDRYVLTIPESTREIWQEFINATA